MRRIALTASAFALFATAAIAQAPAQNGPQNAAVKGVHENNSPKPVAGANSFTMGEAKSHIEARGFTQVTALKKDSDGIWRGTAMKNGASVPVSLDYQGNVH
jgi:hypothetical protein